MKIIFLDIDGVLNYNGLHGNLMQKFGFAPELVNNLRELINKTNAKIVISSSWRVSDYINEDIIGCSPWTKVLENKLNIDGIIIGKIGYKYEYVRYYAKVNNIDFNDHSLDKYKGKYRGYDIKDYLDNHKDINKFVILDDYVSESDIPNVFPNNYVRCRDGFRENEYNKALEILSD